MTHFLKLEILKAPTSNIPPQAVDSQSPPPVIYFLKPETLKALPPSDTLPQASFLP